MKKKSLKNILFASMIFPFIFSSCVSNHQTYNQADDEQEEFVDLSNENFYHVVGNQICDKYENPVFLRGMGLGNNVFEMPKSLSQVTNHHDEKSFEELSNLGFNSVRFLLNYQLFEDDSSPYQFKEDGFQWIKQNIDWAKKYNFKIILNMHFPQGGYQSSGKGTELWNNQSNQNRLCALWKEIARRFKNESAILGFGLVNEPCVIYFKPSDGSREKILQAKKDAVKTWEDLANAITSEIRMVDKNHIIFAECCMINDTNGQWVDTKDVSTFPVINDSNVAYEFHFYTPFQYSHQQLDWNLDLNPKAVTYPDPNYTMAENVQYLDSHLQTLIEESDYKNQWQKKSFVFTGKDLKEKNPNATAFMPSVKPNYLTQNKNGRLFLDDIVVTKTDSKGTTILKNYTFDEKELWTTGSTKTGEQCAYDLSDGNFSKGCIVLSGVKEWGWSSSGDCFKIEDDCIYEISLWYKIEDMEIYTRGESYKNSSFGVDLYSGFVDMGLDSNYLANSLNNVVEPMKDHALYCGEFGLYKKCFKNNRGGCQWVADMIQLFKSRGIHYSYHAYHEQNFGLHQSESTSLPSEEDLNQDLAKTFIRYNQDSSD